MQLEDMIIVSVDDHVIEPHTYDLETYGRSEEIIKSNFARYRDRHIPNKLRLTSSMSHAEAARLGPYAILPNNISCQSGPLSDVPRTKGPVQP